MIGHWLVTGAALVLWAWILWRLIHRGVDLRDPRVPPRRDDGRPW